MADRHSPDSSLGAIEEACSTQSDTTSEIELELLSDQEAKGPLLPGSEKPFETLERTLPPEGSRRTRTSTLVLLVLLCIILAGAVLFLVTRRKIVPETRWNVKNFKSLVAFGDSYTDEARMRYFIEHNNTAPPPGTLLNESRSIAVGGRVWARYVMQYTGSSDGGEWHPTMSLYNYAVGGSFCSGEIVPREYPTLLEYAVPAFAADKAAGQINTGRPYFESALTPSNAVFALWIGTNDLGQFSFLNDMQVGGKTLTDFTDCVYAALDGLYAAGARTFVLMNTMPLHLAPLYANETLHGAATGDLQFEAEKVHELTTSANDIFNYQTPYEFMVSKRYPGAQVALFDVWSLVREVYFHPSAYYNGTAPANVTSYVTQSEDTRSSPDSFMWWDGLHPSEQTGRIIARNFIEVLNGTSKYAQYW